MECREHLELWGIKELRVTQEGLVLDRPVPLELLDQREKRGYQVLQAKVGLQDYQVSQEIQDLKEI